MALRQKIMPQSLPDSCLALPVPPNLARTFGYPGDARYVAFYWDGELMYDDGLRQGAGEWHAFLLYRDHPRVAPELARFNLGGPLSPAADRLIVDCQKLEIFPVSASEATQLLKRSAKASPRELLPRADNIEMEGAMIPESTGKQRIAEEEMLHFLDRWQRPQN